MLRISHHFCLHWDNQVPAIFTIFLDHNVKFYPQLPSFNCFDKVFGKKYGVQSKTIILARQKKKWSVGKDYCVESLTTTQQVRRLISILKSQKSIVFPKQRNFTIVIFPNKFLLAFIPCSFTNGRCITRKQF